MRNHPVELVLDARAILGEGPSWDPRTNLLYWVDIRGKSVHEFDPASNRDRVLPVPKAVGCVVLRENGGAMVALQDGFAELDLATGAVTYVINPIPGRDDLMFNDGKCDPAGRFWAGTKSCTDVAGVGSLYCLDTDRTVREMVRNVTCSNGLAWSHDASLMYYIDTPTHEVSVFDYDLATGTISRRRTAVAFSREDGYPDGMCIDGEGKLWVAFWGGHAVRRFDPETGACLESIPMPVTCPSSCAFGGPALDALYITSASIGLTPAQQAAEPVAGGLFRLHPGIHGVPPFYYRG